MKNTKIMLAVLSVFIVTVLCITTAVWWLQDTWTFKKSLLHGATLFTTVLFGWIPSVVVGNDLHKKLEKEI